MTRYGSRYFNSVAKNIGRANIITGIVSTVTTGAEIYSDYTNPNKEVDPLDVADFLMGILHTFLALPQKSQR
jgi:hypothetical protein